MNKQRLGSLLGALIGVAGLVFVVRRIVRDWDDVADALTSANPAWVVVALACGMAAMSTIGWNWLALLGSDRTPGVLRQGAAWFFVGQLGKYVPGGIWPIVGQAELATRAGSPRPTAYRSTAVSMLATLLAAVTFAVGLGLLSPFDHRWLSLAVGGALVMAFVLLGAAPVRRRTHDVIAKLSRRRLKLPAPRELAVHVARHLPVWLFFSALTACVYRALGGPWELGVVVELAFATCVSWIAGFVVVGVPGGIGVREAVFVSMMTGPVGAGLALSIAVVSRMVSIAADLLGAGGALALTSAQRRATA